MILTGGSESGYYIPFFSSPRQNLLESDSSAAGVGGYPAVCMAGSAYSPEEIYGGGSRSEMSYSRSLCHNDVPPRCVFYDSLDISHTAGSHVVDPWIHRLGRRLLPPPCDYHGSTSATEEEIWPAA